MKKRERLLAILLIVIMILQGGTKLITRAENDASDLEIEDVILDAVDKEQNVSSASGGKVAEDEEVIKTEAVKKAIDWLLANQTEEGYWGG